jgi:hypothetical protein
MAIGVLGQGTSSGPTATIYTCPAGISHAVVHIQFTATGSSGPVRVRLMPGNTSIAVVNLTAAEPSHTLSLSMMLSPGQSIQAFGSASVSTGCVVSGYEVP